MTSSENRFDSVSIALHWIVGMAIIVVAVIEVLRGEIFPRGSYLREALKAFHDPAGTAVFALVLFRLFWRSAHPAPAMLISMKHWEKVTAKLTHYALYVLMVMIPLTGITFTLARGRAIDFGLFQITYPLDHLISRNVAQTLKNIHEFIGQAVPGLAFVHAAAALWHHYIRKDDVLTRMLPALRPTDPR